MRDTLLARALLLLAHVTKHNFFLRRHRAPHCLVRLLFLFTAEEVQVSRRELAQQRVLGVDRVLASNTMIEPIKKVVGVNKFDPHARDNAKKIAVAYSRILCVRVLIVTVANFLYWR